MSLDPALASMGSATTTSAQANRDRHPADVSNGSQAFDLSGFADGDTPLQSGDTPAARSGAANGGPSNDLDVDSEDGAGMGGVGTGDEDEEGEGEDDEDDEEDEEEGYDSDLAAMIEGEIGGASGRSGEGGTPQAGGLSGSTSSAAAAAAAKKREGAGADDSDATGGSDDEDGDSDDLFGKGRSDDEDDDEVAMGDATVKDTEETLEAKRRVRLMADEMKDLENAVSRKKQEVSRAPNPIIRRRFEDSLKKLSSELDLKKAQYAAAQSKLLHVQQEVKRQIAEEEEAANGGPSASGAAAAAGAANKDVAGTATSHTLDSEGLKNPAANSVTAAGSSSSSNPGSANNHKAATGPQASSGRGGNDDEDDDAMPLDGPSPPPQPSSTTNATSESRPKPPHMQQEQQQQQRDAERPPNTNSVGKGRARFSEITSTIAVPSIDSTDISVGDLSQQDTSMANQEDEDDDDDDLFGGAE